MRLFFKSKDGGQDSTVTGYWLIEWKRFFSIVLLHFEDGSRDAYHSHAFNCISWIYSGALIEFNLNADTNIYFPRWKPIITKRDTFHKVVSCGSTWVFSIRGPWAKEWKEYLPDQDKIITLTSGRKLIDEKS